MPDLREKRVDLILQQLEELPTLPAVALRVLEVTGSDSSSAADVVSLIASDPPLTARILKLVHRSDVGFTRDVTTVERAVVMLGFAAVRNAVLSVSVFQMFGGSQSGTPGKFKRDEFWKHCIGVACCCELLAEQAGASDKSMRHMPELDPSEAFLCGLLHDLGKVALDAALPKSFARVVEACDLLRGNIADLERTVIGLDHMVVGKRLAERWQLPATVRDAAWLHGQPPQALPANLKNPRMVNLVTLADLLVREQHLGYSGNYAFPITRGELCDAVGIPTKVVDAAMARVVERIESRATALGLGQSTSEELYRQALAQANQELGRVSSQLAAKNRKLTQRTRFFDALGHFQSALRPDATPQSVLIAAARTAVQVLGTSMVATFSLPPGQDYAETILCDAAGDVVATSLIDLPGMSMVTGDSSYVESDVRLDDLPALAALTSEEEALLSAIPIVEPAGETPVIPSAPATSSPAVSRQDDVSTANPTIAFSGAKPQAAPAPANPAPPDGPVLPAGGSIEWLVEAISPRLPNDKRFWICLESDGAMIGGVVWGAPAGEAARLSPQAPELFALASGWGLALRTAQVRDEARTLAEQLADANRRLHDAQSELLRSKALGAVGEMAAGAAHEMNNPLAVISGRSQLLAQQLEDPKHKAAARLIFEQSHRLSAIISELMDFAKPEAPSVRETDPAELVGRAVHDAKLLHDPADRSFEVAVGAEVPQVAVDERQVAAAIAEVIANAIGATDPAAGHVAVYADHDPTSGTVVVSVTDDGCGMDEATARRAFDPFYSNKPAGRRRGMGLAKALRWIEASGGSIRLQSRPGKGTRAVILLPAVASSRSGATAATTQPPPRQKAV